jgi:G:T/U-mismatch repair DNA glycosylase
MQLSKIHKLQSIDYKKGKAGTNAVLLDPDVAEVFKTPRSVNQALRPLDKSSKAQKQKA